MKYNTIIAFRTSLEKSYSSSTADTYSKAIEWLLSDQHIMDCSKLDIESVLEKLQGIKYKSYYSKYKNAFIKFCDFMDVELSKNIFLELDNMGANKKKKYRKHETVYLKDIMNRIRVIRDKRLKLSYETMLYSGLRISELTQIKKEDCIISNDYITFRFVGKGGEQEQVAIPREKSQLYYENMQELILSTIDKVFYSVSYLECNAKKRGFRCHDLRRAFAKLAYKEIKDISKVKTLLRHKNLKSTKIYLKSKIKI